MPDGVGTVGQVSAAPMPRRPPPKQWVRAALAVGIATGVAIVASSFGVAFLAGPPGTVTVSAADFTFTYTNLSRGSPSPVSGGYSWGGSSPYPLAGKSTSSGQFHAYFEDNASSDCTLWTVGVEAPFLLVNVSVFNNATHWQPGPLPTTLQGKVLEGPNTASWFTLADLYLRLPSVPGSYVLAISATVSC
jgi:hypothetical protein